MAKDLTSLMNDAARLAKQAADAAAAGDVEEAMAKHREAGQLMVRARDLTVLHKRVARRVREPSVREQAIVALTELNVPSAPREIAAYIEAKRGRAFDVRALASIRRDEYRAWQIGSKRDTFLLPALEGPFLVAGRGRFALSHWPLWQRIIGPLTTRADHLRVTLALIDAIDHASPAQATDAQRVARVRGLLAVYARSIPDAVEDAWSHASELDLARIRRAAQSELTLIGGEDERMRRDLAERAGRNLNEEQRLWGGELPQLVAKPRKSD
jgi:hypothetical protein